MLYLNNKAIQKKLLAYRAKIFNVLKAKNIKKYIIQHYYKIKKYFKKVISTKELTINITKNIIANKTEAQTGA